MKRVLKSAHSGAVDGALDAENWLRSLTLDWPNFDQTSIHIGTNEVVRVCTDWYRSEHNRLKGNCPVPILINLNNS
jgi:hypothetical protein